jgi:hypothetical protein
VQQAEAVVVDLTAKYESASMGMQQDDQGNTKSFQQLLKGMFQAIFLIANAHQSFFSLRLLPFYRCTR